MYEFMAILFPMSLRPTNDRLACKRTPGKGTRGGEEVVGNGVWAFSFGIKPKQSIGLNPGGPQTRHQPPRQLLDADV